MNLNWLFSGLASLALMWGEAALSFDGRLHYSPLSVCAMLVVAFLSHHRKEGRKMNNDEDNVEVTSPSGWSAKAQGLTLAAILLSFGLGAAVYAHHIQVDAKLESLHSDTVSTLSRNQAATQAGLKELKESIDNNTYVISRPQKEREDLNIMMPESLRKHLGSERRQREDEHHR